MEPVARLAAPDTLLAVLRPVVTHITRRAAYHTFITIFAPVMEPVARLAAPNTLLAVLRPVMTLIASRAACCTFAVIPSMRYSASGASTAITRLVESFLAFRAKTGRTNKGELVSGVATCRASTIST
jgi:hypothetical protein